MRFINEKNIFLLEEVVRKNFSSQYKDSFLGIIWSVLNPLLMVITLTIIFSTLLGRHLENYPVYLLSGRCIFRYFSGTVGGSLTVFFANQSILKKTAAPKHIFVLGKVISEFFNFFISFLLLIFIMFVTGATFHFSTMPLAILPIISLLILVTGFSLIMSVLAVYYTDLKHLWSVFMQMLLYSSALFYQMDSIPQPFHKYLILNPVYWIIDQFRDFMVFGIMPKTLNIFNSITLSLIILVLGIIIFKKYENNVIMKL